MKLIAILSPEIFATHYKLAQFSAGFGVGDD
jgi:hypothetical protein